MKHLAHASTRQVDALRDALQDGATGVWRKRDSDTPSWAYVVDGIQIGWTCRHRFHQDLWVPLVTERIGKRVVSSRTLPMDWPTRAQAGRDILNYQRENL